MRKSLEEELKERLPKELQKHAEVIADIVQESDWLADEVYAAYSNGRNEGLTEGYYSGSLNLW